LPLRQAVVVEPVSEGMPLRLFSGSLEYRRRRAIFPILFEEPSDVVKVSALGCPFCVSPFAVRTLVGDVGLAKGANDPSTIADH